MFVVERARVNYDQLAPVYHNRYAGENKLDGIAKALESFHARRILDAGCGTGRFIESLRQTGAEVYGLDSSTGMLRQGAARIGSEGLIAGRANELPFMPGVFDLIYCVNAIHHFDRPRDFIRDASTHLKPGGAIAIVGMDPRASCQRYYYQYFDGALDLDMGRYSSFGQLVDWVAGCGLELVELRVVEQAAARFKGTDIFNDPFLAKDSNSLLTLLSGEVYAEGLRRIEAAALRGADFYSELAFGMVTGRRSPNASATEKK